jgi:hypothetical protein
MQCIIKCMMWTVCSVAYSKELKELACYGCCNKFVSACSEQ